MLELVDELVAGTATSGGGGGQAVIEELNVTPSTSAQTITASGGTDGYSPVKVSAVTSSIDANIQAGNIKDGVSILGVTGTLHEPDTITATNKTGSDITAGDSVIVDKQGSSWNIINLYSDIKVFDVVGALTITNKVASSFSTSKYITFANPFNPTNNPWEVRMKVTTGSDVTTEQAIFRSAIGPSNSTAGRFGILSQVISSHFTLGGIYDGASDWSFDGTGTYTVLANTTYWLKIGWSGTEYYLDYSLDGQTFTRDVSELSSSSIYNGLTLTQIGIYSSNSRWINPWKGSVDLNECYINVDGLRWWNPYLSPISENTVTGVASENIASNATGSVKTILP